MSSIKRLKKDINYIFGDIIDEVNIKRILKPEITDEQAEKLVEEAVAAYENFYQKIHQGRKAGNKKSYFKDLTAEINKAVEDLTKKIEAM